MLHPSQGEVFSDNNRFKVLACGRRWGKALAVDTPILTTSGWKTMESVQVGDEVFSPTGVTTKVLAVTEVMNNHNCYEITFKDGERIIADEGHLWSLWSNAKRTQITKEKRGIAWQGDYSGEIKTTGELYDSYLDQKTFSYWGIPNTEPLDAPSQSLPIPPYIFGAWLASDHSHKCYYLKISSLETLKTFYREGYELSLKNNTNHYYCGRLRKEVRDWGFLEIDYIPNRYFSSSLRDRVQLLQGYLEAGGYKIKDNKLSFKCKNKRLLQNLVSLCYSLGQKVSLVENDIYQKGETQDYYRVMLRPTQRLAPLKDKRVLQRLQEHSNPKDRWRFVLRISKVQSTPVRCIQVDSPSEMFCVGNSFVPTHNSRLLFTKAVTKAINFDQPYDPLSPPHCLIAMPTLKQARSIHWLSLLNFLEKHPAVDRVVKSDFRIKFKGNKPDLILRGTNEDGGDNLRGLKLYFVGLDEFQDVKQSVWESVIRPALSDTQGSSALITGTPKGRNSFFHYLFENAKTWKGWNSFTYYTSDNPYIDRNEIENARSMLPPRIFSQEYEASFVDFRGKIFTELSSEHLIPDDELPYFDQYLMGIDWGDVNPAIVVFGLPETPPDGYDRYYLIDYWKNPNQSPKEAIPHEVHNSEIIDRVKSYGISKGYADPSQPGRILSLRKAGFQALKSGYNRVSEGNGIINCLFSQKRLFIAQSCRAAFLEFEAYHRAEKDGIILEDVAPDQEDHVTDGSRYVLATREHFLINQLLNPQKRIIQPNSPSNGLYTNTQMTWEEKM